MGFIVREYPISPFAVRLIQIYRHGLFEYLDARDGRGGRKDGPKLRARPVHGLFRVAKKFLKHEAVQIPLQMPRRDASASARPRIEVRHERIDLVHRIALQVGVRPRFDLDVPEPIVPREALVA